MAQSRPNISDAVMIPSLCTAPYSPAIVETFHSQEFDNDTWMIVFIKEGEGTIWTLICMTEEKSCKPVILAKIPDSCHITLLMVM